MVLSRRSDTNTGKKQTKTVRMPIMRLESRPIQEKRAISKLELWEFLGIQGFVLYTKGGNSFLFYLNKHFSCGNTSGTPLDDEPPLLRILLLGFPLLLCLSGFFFRVCVPLLSLPSSFVNPVFFLLLSWFQSFSFLRFSFLSFSLF